MNETKWMVVVVRWVGGTSNSAPTSHDKAREYMQNTKLNYGDMMFLTEIHSRTFLERTEEQI